MRRLNNRLSTNRKQLEMKTFSLVAILALGGLVVCSTMATAQEAKGGKKGGKGGGRPSVDQQVEQMTADLKLTDEQKPKVKAALEDTSKKMRELMSGGEVPREQMREKMQPIMEEQSKKLKEILTSEQFAKWQKMREERRSRAGGGEKKKNKTE